MQPWPKILQNNSEGEGNGSSTSFGIQRFYKIIMKLLDGVIVSTIVHKNNNPEGVRESGFLHFFYSNFIQFYGKID